MEGVWHSSHNDRELFEEVKDITLNNLETILSVRECRERGGRAGGRARGRARTRARDREGEG